MSKNEREGKTINEKDKPTTKKSRLRIVKDHSSDSFSKNNNLFYKVENHNELFKLGSSYLNDFNNGLKSFAIGSTGYENAQQKTILGLASFFDHYSDYRICIISDNLFKSTFKDIISSAKKGALNFGSDDMEVPIFNFHGHFDFIDLNILLGLGIGVNDREYEKKLEDIVSYYNIVFWDLPDLSKIKNEGKNYYSMIRCFDSLSIVVSASNCNEKDIENIRTFFQSYSINIKGLVFDAGTSEEEESNKVKIPWWKRLFK
jgi:hypothetical protein